MPRVGNREMKCMPDKTAEAGGHLIRIHWLEECSKYLTCFQVLPRHNCFLLDVRGSVAGWLSELNVPSAMLSSRLCSWLCSRLLGPNVHLTAVESRNQMGERGQPQTQTTRTHT